MKERVRDLFIIAITIAVICMILALKPFALLMVRSGSMEPSIMTGSICVVDRICDMERISIGDVIVFSMWDGTLVAHRVADRNRHGFVTKGDANNSCDVFTVTDENYYGKVVFSF